MTPPSSKTRRPVTTRSGGTGTDLLDEHALIYWLERSGRIEQHLARHTEVGHGCAELVAADHVSVAVVTSQRCLAGGSRA